jgi:hypothetical protein
LADDPNKMSPEQAAKALAWLEENWTQKRECPVCGSDNWHVAEHFVAPPLLGAHGGYWFGGPAYPHMLVTSTKCGYAMFVNAIIAGVFEVPKADSVV